MNLTDNDIPYYKMYSKLEEIRRLISRPALYEQMAEECSELTQALLKKARKLRDENHTPKTFDEIDNDILEEYTDVMLCARVLNLECDFSLMDHKIDRWIFRNSEIAKNLYHDGEEFDPDERNANENH